MAKLAQEIADRKQEHARKVRQKAKVKAAERAQQNARRQLALGLFQGNH